MITKKFNKGDYVAFIINDDEENVKKGDIAKVIRSSECAVLVEINGNFSNYWWGVNAFEPVYDFAGANII